MSTGTNINGPINLARVEGKINNIDKVLHFFMDYHENIEHQTVCSDIRSKDISKFFMEDVFDKADKSGEQVDFYIESVPMYHENGATKTEGRYADRVINLLLKSFTTKKRDDVYGSDEFKNVTLHYVDIRPYVFQELDALFDELLKYKGFIWTKKNINQEIAIGIEKAVIIIKDKLNQLWKKLSDTSSTNNNNNKNNSTKDLEIMLRSNKIALNKEDPDQEEDIINVKKKLMNGLRKEYIISKIKNDYKNPKVGTSINNYIQTDMDEVFKYLFNKADEILAYLQTVKKDTGSKESEDNLVYTEEQGVSYGLARREITNHICKLDGLIDDLFSKWFIKIPSKYMDLYILRKLLDQDHKNIILYTGIEHSISIIYFLVKHFDFKITNMANITDISISDLNSKLKTTNYDNIRQHFFPKILKQCIDVSAFPDITSSEELIITKEELTKEEKPTEISIRDRIRAFFIRK